MKEYQIREILSKGLRPNKNVRNNPYLIESLGAFPYEGVLQAVEQFTRIGMGAVTCSFPYPQLFVLSEVIVVCTSTAIYELVGGSLVLKIGSLTAGTTWDMVDFKTFLYFTNGKVSVRKEADTGVYSVDATLPTATCLCNYNGQLLIGSINVPVTGNI